MITIPFANRLGPRGGPAADGVIYGIVPQVAPISVLSQVQMAQSTSVLRGNADAAGSVTWSDITAAANNDTVGDVALFDTANPTADMLCIALSTGDEINGISLLVSTAGALAGTPAAEVRYRTSSGWATATAIATPLLTSAGLKRVTFGTIKFADVAPTDNVLDPFSGPQQRCLFLRFTGITGVTTAPLFTRVWKNQAIAGKAVNYTAPLAQGASPDFSTLQSVIIPVTGDLTLFGFDERFVRLFPTIYRPTAAGLGAREWVYSKSDGTFAALPAANLNDPSARFSSPLVGLAAARAVDFPNTAASRIDVATAPAITGSFSISVWLYKTGAGIGTNATIVDVGNHLANTGFGLWFEPSSGKLAVRLRQDYNHYRTGTALTLNTWTHVVVTWDDATDTVRIYLDGVLKDTETGRSANPTAAASMRFGDREGTFNERYTGRMDELQIYNTVLSQSDISGLWNYGKGLQGTGTETGLVAAWHFDETSGTTTNSYAGSFNGTLNVATPGATAKSDWSAPVTTVHIPIVPPSDWGKASMTDTGDVAHNRYWLGWRYTADTAAPVLPFNATLRGQPVKGTGVSGIPAPETATYTTATIVARDTALADETLLLVNAATGLVVNITVPANTAIHSQTVDLQVTKGDLLLIVQSLGHATVNLGDGAVFLS